VNPEFPSLDKEGLGVVDIWTDLLFSTTFSLCSGNSRSADLQVGTPTECFGRADLKVSATHIPKGFRAVPLFP
jgi:hypothetical protein